MRSISNEEVRVNVTLSYYVEPNPGNRFSSKYYYQSHGLRFDMKRAVESVENFLKRNNDKHRAEDEKFKNDSTSEEWQIGKNGRTNGSIHRDTWIGTAEQLIEKNHIVVMPITGWWRTRDRLEKYNSKCRYSLIINIETPDIEVDIYSPIASKIGIEIKQ